MRMTFEIFPTKNIMLRCVDIINTSLEKINYFLENNKIHNEIVITVKEVNDRGEIINNHKYLLTKENKHMLFNINDNGKIYVFSPACRFGYDVLER